MTIGDDPAEPEPDSRSSPISAEPATASGEGSRPLSRPCPICGKPAEPAFRPFCSSRCADVDLNRWLSGTYAVPGEPVANDDDPMPDER